MENFRNLYSYKLHNEQTKNKHQCSSMLLLYSLIIPNFEKKNRILEIFARNSRCVHSELPFVISLSKYKKNYVSWIFIVKNVDVMEIISTFWFEEETIIFHLQVMVLINKFKFKFFHFKIFSTVLTIKSILIQQSNHIVVNNLRISFCITTAKFHIIYITIYIATGNGQKHRRKSLLRLENQILWKFVFILCMNYIPNITW